MTAIDRAGLPFVGGALLLAAGAAVVGGSWWWAVPFVALAAFLAFFFRDPHRPIADDPLAVISPADGRVMVAGDGQPSVAPEGDWQQVSIFLSPMDVHINRVPFGGRLTRVSYQPGRFLPAYRTESGSQNERTELWVERDGRTVVFRQVVGVLARRVVCRVREGDVVATGDRFGLMKFGSRMDVFVDREARLLVRPGDMVVAGVTRLAEFPEAKEPAAERPRGTETGEAPGDQGARRANMGNIQPTSNAERRDASPVECSGRVAAGSTDGA